MISYGSALLYCEEGMFGNEMGYGFPEVLSFWPAILPFKFEVHHVLGKMNVTADYLPCCPSENLEGEYVVATLSQC